MHVLAVERVATAKEGGRDDETVIDTQLVSLGEFTPQVVCGKIDRSYRCSADPLAWPLASRGPPRQPTGDSLLLDPRPPLGGV